LKHVTPMRAQGLESTIVGLRPISAPSLNVTVANPLSGALSSCVCPSGSVTLIWTIGFGGGEEMAGPDDCAERAVPRMNATTAASDTRNLMTVFLLCDVLSEECGEWNPS